ncbi:MAG TPA: alpha/beta fold hydrolase, partial [Prolixibacteraceae bacterium]|nr:alpha/beta fold hydrolase [Prolixibacteraceae bacterium]
ATDVESAVAYLKTRSEIDHKKIGLMGHSEGGLIAPMVAAKDKSIAFIVLLAGPGMSGKELLPLQSALIAKAQGAPEQAVASTTKINSTLFAMINTTDTREALNNKIINYIKSEIDPNELPEEFKNNELLKAQIDQLTSPWMRYFLNYDPLPTLAKVTCPVLALNGEKDLQVPPKENLSAIKNTLSKAGNKQVTCIEMKGLNHVLQECETGSPAEYAQIEQTISEKALTTISNWIAQNTANK